LILDEVQARSAGPSSIAIHPTSPEAAPDIAAWQSELGIALRMAGTWDWRTVPPGAGVSLVQERQRWRLFSGAPSQLRPAAWILGGALALHAVALVVDWTSLANEQRTLRQKMEARFRASFPGAVAVVDPALQMRRKLSEARHAAGQPDSGDFLPMIERVMAGMKDLPEGSLRVLSYESGRMALELSATEDAAVNRIVTRLTQSGMSVERSAAPKRPGGGTVVLTVRAS
jgi:general secretion pathway protein L